MAKNTGKSKQGKGIKDKAKAKRLVRVEKRKADIAKNHDNHLRIVAEKQVKRAKKKGKDGR